MQNLSLIIYTVLLIRKIFKINWYLRYHSSEYLYSNVYGWYTYMGIYEVVCKIYECCIYSMLALNLNIKFYSKADGLIDFDIAFIMSNTFYMW